MGKREPILDWQMLEENVGWPQVVSAPRGMMQAWRLPRRPRWWALAILLAAMLPVLVEGYGEVRRANQAMNSVEDEVRAAVAAEEWVQQHRTRSPAFFAQAGSQADSSREIVHEQGLEARQVEMRGDYAMVEVWTTASSVPWLPAPYRETRFYQETERGWLATEPPDVLGKPIDTLQAGRFTFVYGPRDASAVLEATRHVEAEDAALRAELGLRPTDESLTIKVVTAFLPSLDPVDLAHLSSNAMAFAPSPALLPLPAQISEGDALLQLVAGLLAQRDLDEAMAGSPYACHWQHVVNGLHRWLLKEHSSLPSQFRYMAARRLLFKLAHGSVPNLSWYGPAQDACLPDRDAQSMAGSYIKDAAAPGLVDYVVLVYGRDGLPALIDGLKRYDTWQRLIPAVYGVSAGEFETGWQAYMRDHYLVADAGQQVRLNDE